MKPNLLNTVIFATLFVSVGQVWAMNSCEEILKSSWAYESIDFPPTYAKEHFHEVVSAIQESLTQDVLTPSWRKKLKEVLSLTDPPPVNYDQYGHCYRGSEALYHMLGGRLMGLKPIVLRTEEGTHWFLQDADQNFTSGSSSQVNYVVDDFIDITVEQFVSVPEHKEGNVNGMFDSNMSKDARTIIIRAARTLELKGILPQEAVSF